MALNVDLANEGGLQVIGDGGEANGVFQVKTGGAVSALVVGKTAVGTQTIAPFKLLGSSIASGALIEIGGGFISLTSVILTSVAHTDYAIPVQIGLETRYIPVFKAAALVGGAAF